MGALRALLGLSASLRAPLGVPLSAKPKASMQKARLFRGPWTTGHSVLAVCAAPFIYSAAKSMYMTARMRRLDTQEILSDRFTWLHERMLEDEVDALLIQQVENSKVDRTQPLLRLGPSFVRLNERREAPPFRSATAGGSAASATIGFS
ncbi:hypothetical protein Efla_004017 [Eimeria flavescens]